jgi:hypothetical protein
MPKRKLQIVRETPRLGMSGQLCTNQISTDTDLGHHRFFKMYLAAYAQRLGATGLTFFDDDVTNFFSPYTKGKRTIFLLAIASR